MQVSHNIHCCGIRELANIQEHRSPEEVLKRLYLYFRPYSHGEAYTWPRPLNYCHQDARWRHAIFSQAGRRVQYGDNLAAYIREHNLGPVVETITSVNPNSGRPLKAYLWTIDHPSLRQWFIDNIPNADPIQVPRGVLTPRQRPRIARVVRRNTPRRAPERDARGRFVSRARVGG